MPFSLEGFAFFFEAIFLGIYVYGWGRLPGRTHLMMLVPIMAAGVTVHAGAGLNGSLPATDDDWGREYLEMDIAAKLVDDVDGAIAHINAYSSHHTEAILTEDGHSLEEADLGEMERRWQLAKERGRLEAAESPSVAPPLPEVALPVPPPLPEVAPQLVAPPRLPSVPPPLPAQSPPQSGQRAVSRAMRKALDATSGPGSTSAGQEASDGNLEK